MWYRPKISTQSRVVIIFLSSFLLWLGLNEVLAAVTDLILFGPGAAWPPRPIISFCFTNDYVPDWFDDAYWVFFLAKLVVVLAGIAIASVKHKWRMVIFELLIAFLLYDFWFVIVFSAEQLLSTRINAHFITGSAYQMLISHQYKLPNGLTSLFWTIAMFGLMRFFYYLPLRQFFLRVLLSAISLLLLAGLFEFGLFFYVVDIYKFIFDR